jgi:hypothetical protein
MNRIVKNSLIFCSMLAVLTIPLSGVMAMMGGGSHGGVSGGFVGGSGGDAIYDEHMGSGYDGHLGGVYGSMGYSGGSGAMMSPAAAENRIRDYMNGRISQPYNLGRMDDSGSYYLTDILNQDGIVVDRVMIDKYSGNVRSIR